MSIMEVTNIKIQDNKIERVVVHLIKGTRLVTAINAMLQAMPGGLSFGIVTHEGIEAYVLRGVFDVSEGH